MSGRLRQRAAIDRVQKFVPARTTESVKREFRVDRVIKLDGNENRLGCSPRARQALIDGGDELAPYPDVACTVLAEKLAGVLGVDGSRLVFDNGLFALLSTLAQVFLDPGDEALIPEPTFGWYRIATLAMGAEPVSVPLDDHRIDLDAVAERINGRTKLVFLCNPNNPTGTSFTDSALRKFLAAVPSRVGVILDEAYCEFAEGEDFPDAIRLLEQHPNLIVLRTFSKLHGLAGLRLGYGIMDPALAAQVHKIRPPVNVSSLAQVVGVAAIEDLEFQARVLRHVREEKEFFHRFCREAGIRCVPSDTNFIMLDIGTDSDFVVAELTRHGILVRGGKDFGLPTCLRVTLGTHEENLAVVGHLSRLRSRFAHALAADAIPSPS